MADGDGDAWMVGHVAGIGDCVYETRQVVNIRQIRRLLRLTKFRDEHGKDGITLIPWGPIALGLVRRDEWCNIPADRIGPEAQLDEASRGKALEQWGLPNVVAAQAATLSLLDQARAAAARGEVLAPAIVGGPPA